MDEPQQHTNNPADTAANSSTDCSSCLQQQAKLKEYEAGWKRALADYQNLRKETETERMRMVGFIQNRLFTELIPIADHFDEAIRSLPPEVNSQWQEGLRHVRKELSDLFGQYHIESFGKEGESFDPQIHEAVDTVVNANKPAGSIERVIALGYSHQGICLRPARVVVIQSGPDNNSLE